MREVIGIIGAGRVGTALGVGLSRNRYNIVVASRSFTSAKTLADRTGGEAYENPADVAYRSDVLFITTPDREISSVCIDLVNRGAIKSGMLVFHVSGAFSSQILLPCKEVGAYIGSFHPLQSFADKEEAIQNVPGSFFVIEGDQEALECGEILVANLGGRLLQIKPEVKPLYHAGACSASNYLVTVVYLATKLLEAAGIPEDLSLKALLPLIEGTVKNLKRDGLPDALTGPISRGDIPTLEEHFKAISKYIPEVIDLYSKLGKHTIEIGLAKKTIGPHEGHALEEFIRAIEDKEGAK